MDNFTAERQNDSVLTVHFYTDAIKNGVESDAAGRPVFMDVEMVRILVPGDNKLVIDTKVDETHKFRFPRQYKAFKEGLTTQIRGWILKEWPAVTASQVKELNYHEVHTVEQLSNLSDASVHALGMGMYELRTKAKAALEAAAGNAENEARALREENLQRELDSMKSQLAALNAAALDNKRGPGRPKAE